MKQFSLLLIILFLFSQCKKEEDDDGGDTPVPDPIGNAPSNFTRKILIENFTGEWNPNCPTGDDSLRTMLSLDTQKFIAVSIHQGDWLAQTVFFDSLSAHLGGVNGFPRAAFNRKPAAFGTQLDSVVISIFNWRQNLLPMQSLSANCGMALVTKLSNETLTVHVHAASNVPLTGDLRLNLYLVEDSVAAQNQLNAPPNYIHNHVLRNVFNAALGDTLSLNGVGKTIKTYTKNISGLYANKKHLRIIAFLHRVGATYKEHEILNVQSASLNETKMWD